MKKRWIKYERNKWDIENNGGLCPICNQDNLEILVGEYTNEEGEHYDDYTFKERCSGGCYVFNFKTMKREK